MTNKVDVGAAFDLNNCILFLLDVQREVLRGNKAESIKMRDVAMKKLQDLKL